MKKSKITLIFIFTALIFNSVYADDSSETISQFVDNLAGHYQMRGSLGCDSFNIVTRNNSHFSFSYADFGDKRIPNESLLFSERALKVKVKKMTENHISYSFHDPAGMITQSQIIKVKIFTDEHKNIERLNIKTRRGYFGFPENIDCKL